MSSSRDGSIDSFEFGCSVTDDDYQLIEPATQPKRSTRPHRTSAHQATEPTDSTTTAAEVKQVEASEDEEDTDSTSPSIAQRAAPHSPLRTPTSPRALPAYSPLSIPLAAHNTASQFHSPSTSPVPLSLDPSALSSAAVDPSVSSSRHDEQPSVLVSSERGSCVQDPSTACPSSCSQSALPRPPAVPVLLPHLSPSFLRGAGVVVSVLLLLGLVKLTYNTYYHEGDTGPPFSVA